jgi:hypothetical protein
LRRRVVQPSPAEIERADRLVAVEASLWTELEEEMSRFGHVELVPDGLEFVAEGESSGRVFAISPAHLRECLVFAKAQMLANGYPPSALRHLPQWFIDELWEILALEEPFDEPYVVLGRECHFTPSARPS